MQEFDVIVHRTLYVDFLITAASKEQAERIARKRIEEEYEDSHDWEDYGPKDIKFFVEKPRR